MKYHSGAAKGTNMKEICIFQERLLPGFFVVSNLPLSKKSSVPYYFLSPLDVFFRGLIKVVFFIQFSVQIILTKDKHLIL